jgi:two-component system sensor histidine kinase and response regulator WspE
MNDFSMMGLFKMEAESQCAALTSNLLKLEKNPTAIEVIEPLMRAAHSLKGAARIVQLNPIVKLAHTMEDCFVAAAEGKITLNGAHIDTFLDCVDCFNLLSRCSEEEIETFLTENEAKMSGLATALTNTEAGKTTVAAEPATTHPAVEPATTHPAAEPAAEKISRQEKNNAESDAFVKISTEKMTRLMGLAAESLVGVKRLQHFEKHNLRQKKSLLELDTLLDQLGQLAITSGKIDETKLLLKAIQQHYHEHYRKYNEYCADFSDYARTIDNFSDSLYREVVSCRMRPFIDGVKDFPRSVRDLARNLGKKINFEISGENSAVDKDILDKLTAPLNHLIRNAADHGIEMPEERLKSKKNETGSIRLSAQHRAGMLNIAVADDGKGIDIEKIRRKAVEKGLALTDVAAKLSEAELLEFMFLPGFSTAATVTETSGRGVGLDVVQTMVQEVRGLVKVETVLGQGTTFNLQLPVSLSIMPALVINISGEPYALPLTRITHLLKLRHDEIMTLEGRQFIKYEGKNIGLVPAAQILELTQTDIGAAGEIHIIIISDRLNQYAVFVDNFIGEFELVVRPLDARLGKVSDISSTAVLDDGTPVLILDADDMVRSIDTMLNGGRILNIDSTGLHKTATTKKRILVVDDSITVREVERNLLKNHGYEVDVAVDGAEGWNAVRACQYALVITDVDMPRMNGIELVTHIKQHERLKSLPVMIVSYKDREADRIKGLEAGADYYLTKSSFHDNTLLEVVSALIGKAEL